MKTLACACMALCLSALSGIAAEVRTPPAPEEAGLSADLSALPFEDRVRWAMARGDLQVFRGPLEAVLEGRGLLVLRLPEGGKKNIFWSREETLFAEPVQEEGREGTWGPMTASQFFHDYSRKSSRYSVVYVDKDNRAVLVIPDIS